MRAAPRRVVATAAVLSVLFALTFWLLGRGEPEFSPTAYTAPPTGQADAAGSEAAELAPGPPDRALPEPASMLREPVAPELAVQPDERLLTVLVVDPRGHPLAGASVQVWDPPSPNSLRPDPTEPRYGGTTGADGVCKLCVVPSLWRVRAELGDASASEWKRVDWREVERHGRMLITAAPLARLYGAVLDEELRPVVRANVRIQPGWRGLDEVDQVQTDARGEFSVAVIADRELRVRGTHTGGSTSSVTTTIAAGQSARLILHTQGTHELAGSVQDAAGLPQPALEVELTNAGGFEALRTSDEHGGFLFELADPGDYVLRVRDQGAVVLQESASIAPHARRVRVDLQLPSRPKIAGRLFDSNGAALAGRFVIAEPAAASEDWGAAVRSVVTDPDGWFELRHLREGASYDVRAHPVRGNFGQAVIASAVAAGTPDLILRVDQAQQNGARIELALIPPAGKPIRAPFAELWRETSGGAWREWPPPIRSMRTDGTQVFLDGLPLGQRFMLAVITELRGPVHFVGPFTTAPHTRLRVADTAVGSILATALSADGTKPAVWTVTIAHLDPLLPAGQAMTMALERDDAAGPCRMRITAGHYRVSARGPDGESGSQDVSVTAGQQSVVHLVMR